MAFANYISIKMKQTVRYFNRIMVYIALGAPLLVLAPTTVWFGKWFPRMEDVAWDYCLWSVTKLGPTFIKLAQWASTRPDLFPPKLVLRLQSLQEHVVVPYKFDVVEKTLKDAFGENWRDAIEIDPNPIGAGCVAQVFRGKLHPAYHNVPSSSSKNKSKVSAVKEDINVAIKMIHPHVESMVTTDMELLSIFAHLLDRIPSLEMLNMGETLTQFGDMMKKQLDLRNEARNLSTFSKKFKNDPWALFPSPIEGFVRKNVLVETLMEGSSIVNYMTLQPLSTVLSKAGEVDAVTRLKLRLSDLGCRLILKMVFFDNFIHGDLHPGNILVHFDNKGEPHLVILDCGIVYQSKTEEEHNHLVDICFAFMNHDGRTAAKLMIDKSKHTDPRHADDFCDAVQGIITNSEHVSYFENLGVYISQICELSRVYAVKLDPGYFAIAMALKVVEGVSLALNKDVDMVSKCVPIILKTRAMRALGFDNFPVPTDAEFNGEAAVEKLAADQKRSRQQELKLQRQLALEL